MISLLLFFKKVYFLSPSIFHTNTNTHPHIRTPEWLPWGCGRHCPRFRCRKLPATQHTPDPHSPSWGPGTLKLKDRKNGHSEDSTQRPGFFLSPTDYEHSSLTLPRKQLNETENLSPSYLILFMCVCLVLPQWCSDARTNWEEHHPGHCTEGKLKPTYWRGFWQTMWKGVWVVSGR